MLTIFFSRNAENIGFLTKQNPRAIYVFYERSENHSSLKRLLIKTELVYIDFFKKFFKKCFHWHV